MPHGVQSQERIVDALSGFGFSESQASVYAVLLRLGRCSVRDLASATGFSRITIQGILDKFEGDHIVCGVYEGKKKRMYSPANIRGLKSLLDGQIDKLEQQRDAIASLFAEATEADRKAPRGFGVHALRGVRGMEFLRDDILQCNADISIFGDVSALSAHDYANLSRVYFPAVLQAHIPMRFLLLDTVHARRFLQALTRLGVRASMRRTKFVAPRNTRLTVAYAVYADRVVLCNQKTLSVALIRDGCISDGFRLLFSKMWKTKRSSFL